VLSIGLELPKNLLHVCVARFNAHCNSQLSNSFQKGSQYHHQELWPQIEVALQITYTTAQYPPRIFFRSDNRVCARMIAHNLSIKNCVGDHICTWNDPLWTIWQVTEYFQLMDRSGRMYDYPGPFRQDARLYFSRISTISIWQMNINCSGIHKQKCDSILSCSSLGYMEKWFSVDRKLYASTVWLHFTVRQQAGLHWGSDTEVAAEFSHSKNVEKCSSCPNYGSRSMFWFSLLFRRLYYSKAEYSK
jgi:hypothetical protein